MQRLLESAKGCVKLDLFVNILVKPAKRTVYQDMDIFIRIFVVTFNTTLLYSRIIVLI